MVGAARAAVTSGLTEQIEQARDASRLVSADTPGRRASDPPNRNREVAFATAGFIPLAFAGTKET